MRARIKALAARLRTAGLALAGGSLLAVAALTEPGANYILTIDRGLGDDALYTPGNPEPREELVFLGIDEDSMTMQGLDPELIASEPNLSRMSQRFPWDRRVYADVLEKLFSAGAKLVAIDLVFAEASDPEADAVLAATLAKYADKVILAAQFAPMDTGGEGFFLQEPLYDFIESDPYPEYGFVNLRPDVSDQQVRFAYYSSSLAEENGAAPIQGEPRFDSLAGAILKKMGKPAPFDRAQIKYAVEEPYYDKPDENTVVRINPGGTRIYKPVSIRNLFIPDEWEHRFKSGEYFRDKVIMIGPAFARSQDVHKTPAGMLWGPQVHLQAIGSGLSDSYSFRPFGEWQGGVVLMAALGAVVAAILALFIKKPIVALVTVIATIAGVVGAAFAYARFGSVWIGPTPFSAAFFVGAVTGQTWDLLRERQERSRLHNQFRRFVSRDVADSLVNDPSIYQHAALGRKRRVVVVFSDIRGFTSLSEQISPEELFSLLNEYLSAMVKIIFAHGGTLDKFIGDAILAHWGALDDGDERKFAASALAAAQDMIKELERLNAEWKERGLKELGIGVGLHLGEVLAGEIGSEQRTEFGVIGDAVNLASRLEGMTKAFSCQWMGSGQFMTAAGGQDTLRRIARVRVKGREEPVDLWTTTPSEAARTAYAGALALFEKGDFLAAFDALETYLAEYPADKIASHLHRYAKQFKEDPPENWEGVIRFTEK
jgi:adenylate cyclase